jgi:LysM repeat protein
VARASTPVPPQAVPISNPPEHTAAAANGEVEDRISESTYRVREGDTLWEIARRSGVSVSELARANRRSQRSSLRPGVVLRIPR